MPIKIITDPLLYSHVCKIIITMLLYLSITMSISAPVLTQVSIYIKDNNCFSSRLNVFKVIIAPILHPVKIIIAPFLILDLVQYSMVCTDNDCSRFILEY